MRCQACVNGSPRLWCGHSPEFLVFEGLLRGLGLSNPGNFSPSANYPLSSADALKNWILGSMVVHIYIPALGAEAKDWYKFQASLGYRMRA